MTTEISQDTKNLVLLTWLGTLFFGFIPGLIMYLVKKDDDYIQEQSKEALNWSITAIIGYTLSAILVVILIGGILMAVVGICHVVFCIMGAMAGSRGESYRAPFNIRLIK